MLPLLVSVRMSRLRVLVQHGIPSAVCVSVLLLIQLLHLHHLFSATCRVIPAGHCRQRILIISPILRRCLECCRLCNISTPVSTYCSTSIHRSWRRLILVVKGRRRRRCLLVAAMILRTSWRGAASIAARKASTAAFSSATEAARDAPNDRKNDEGADDNADYHRPFTSCPDHMSVPCFGNVRIRSHVPICLRHALIPSRERVLDACDVATNVALPVEGRHLEQCGIEFPMVMTIVDVFPVLRLLHSRPLVHARGKFALATQPSRPAPRHATV